MRIGMLDASVKYRKPGNRPTELKKGQTFVITGEEESYYRGKIGGRHIMAAKSVVKVIEKGEVS